MKKVLLFFPFLFLFLPFALRAEEGGIEINPYIIDEKAKAGDILKYDIVIKNNSQGKANLYAIVNDISKSEGDVDYLDPSDLDKSTSIARWISFKRGVIEIMPGGSMSVPLEINISGTALPGQRFARIALPNGPNRPEAEGNMAANSFVQLPINIEIIEDIIEKAQIKEFMTRSKVFVNPPFIFDLEIENNGNKDIVPEGNVYVYNRRGEEVSSLDINPEKVSIPSEENWTKEITWDSGKGFGKFKAKLEAEYGEKDKRDLQDTLYFWYFPWKLLMIVFIGTFLLLAIIVTLIFRKTFIHHEANLASTSIQVRQSKVGSKDIINLKK